MGLTRRELEILTLVAEGHSNAQLARMLWVTEQTVKFHLSNIYRKLNVSNRPRRAGGRRCTGCCRSPRRAPRRPSNVRRNGTRPPPDQSGAAAGALWAPVNLAEMEAGVYPPEGEAGHFPLGLREDRTPREGLEGRLMTPSQAGVGCGQPAPV